MEKKQQNKQKSGPEIEKYGWADRPCIQKLKVTPIRSRVRFYFIRCVPFSSKYYRNLCFFFKHVDLLFQGLHLCHLININ